MSLYDYQYSQELAKIDPPFYALIMMALRKADTENAKRLRLMWPETCSEFERRYNAPGGVLPTDPAQHPANRDEWADEHG